MSTATAIANAFAIHDDVQSVGKYMMKYAHHKWNQSQKSSLIRYLVDSVLMKLSYFNLINDDQAWFRNHTELANKILLPPTMRCDDAKLIAIINLIKLGSRTNREYFGKRISTVLFVQTQYKKSYKTISIKSCE